MDSSYGIYYVMIALKGSNPILLGGTEEPAAHGELASIGGLSPDVNKSLSSVVASSLEKKLSMDGILRPAGYAIIRESSYFADAISTIARGMRWSCRREDTI
ncbi:hypothetical protein SADUNF_Sadunf16G0108400 [Salix dunnii]|uniref:Uncharacterized protein n=1 Tax=Salix dunnii TaxID=1413687 RepID=A0A835MGM3_9ROSI|nr:hypothetical protein SADUNF_Sadunf16G0108400 [Salix dunnii]